MRPRLEPVDRQTIVITGATSGNGLAAAREAVRRAAAVVIAARNRQTLEAVANDLGRRGGRVAFCAVHVSGEADVERIAETAVAAFGGFDSWVNDAAAATRGAMERVPMEDHRRIFDVNYHGLLMGSSPRPLRSRGGGAIVIVNLGSVLSDRAMIYRGFCSAIKAAVQAATDTLRIELERDGAGISVTLIKPGSINTPYPEHARNYMGSPPRLPPRATGLAMGAFGVGAQQKPGDPGDPHKRDNLYQPKADGRSHGAQDVFVRRTSLFLQAQTQPLLLPFAVAAAGAEMAGGFARRLLRRPHSRGRGPAARRPAASAEGLPGSSALISAGFTRLS
jgi:NAD(P)-dependent dehydrogenase (short-subunit alcohol dehydrogenase family)